MTQFRDEEHALKAGMLLGLLKAAGIPAFPQMDDEGNYTASIQLRFTLAKHEIMEIEIEVKPSVPS